MTPMAERHSQPRSAFRPAGLGHFPTQGVANIPYSIPSSGNPATIGRKLHRPHHASDLTVRTQKPNRQRGYQGLNAPSFPW